MSDFPINEIVFSSARLSGVKGSASIEIAIEPFSLAVDGYSEDVNTSIRLDAVNIPVSALELEGKVFTFPVNPLSGYIDGSVYFFAAHHPVDVYKITFGAYSEGKLPISLESKWILEFENSGFKNLCTVVESKIEL